MRRVGKKARHGSFRLAKYAIVTTVTMAFGFYSDRPAKVNPNPKAEPLQERLSQWAGAGFWIVFSLLLLKSMPLVGLAAVAFSAFVIMRRMAASRGFGWPLAGIAKEARKRLGKPALAAIALAAAVVLVDALGWPTPVAGAVRLALWASVTGAAVWVGSGYARAKSAERKLHFLHDAKLAAVLGVSEAAVAGTGLAFDKKTNELTIFPLPAQAAFKRGDIENRLRQVAPEWEYVDAESSHERVVLASASFATMETRESLAATGGLIAGSSEAADVQAETVDLPAGYVDTVESHAKLSKSLDRNLGEGWSIQEIRGTEAVIVRGAPHPRPGAQEFDLGEDLKFSDGGRVAKMIAKQTGLTMVAWDPEEDVAIGANLLPSTVELRERLARELGKELWQIELAPRYANGELAAVTLLRHDTRVPGDREKRIAFWLDKAQNVIGHRGWYVDVDDRTGFIHFKTGVIRSLPKLARAEDLLPGHIDVSRWAKLPLGRNPEGEIVGIDLKLGPHSMMAGPTGSGKTIALRQIALSGLSSGHEVLMADPMKEGADFTIMRPWMSAWAETIEEAADVVVTAYNEGVRRKAILKEYGVGFWADLPEDVRERENIRPVLLMVDEFVSTVLPEEVPKTLSKEHPMVVEANRKNELKALISMYAGKIARESRFVGIHLSIAMQRPDAKIIGGEFRSNLTSAIQLATPGKLPARETLNMLFSGEELVSATEILSELDNGRSLGLGVMGSDGGETDGFRVGFMEVDEIPGFLEGLGVKKPKQWIIEQALKDDEGYSGAPAFRKPTQTPAPAVPAVVDLGEMDLDWGDLDLGGDQEEGTGGAETHELVDPFAAEEPNGLVPVLDEDPFGDPEPARVAPAVDEDPFEVAPRKVTVPDDDPFETVPAKTAAAKVANFEWD